jgi:hypothetical protein
VLIVQVNKLNDLINTNLTAIEAERDNLTRHLESANRYIGHMNFTATSVALNYAQQELNARGDAIVAAFVNRTADTMFDKIVKFSTDAVYAVEYEVAHCRPLYSSIKTVIDATCVYLAS